MNEPSECLILVDNSNVWIEGMKFSARKKGLQDEQDWSWRIDFGALLKVVANGHKIIGAILVGSEPPPNDSVWNAAREQGFQVITYQRSAAGEKAVDTELVAQGLKIIYKHGSPAILKLLSGDRDFLPLIRCAYEEGWENELWGFGASLSNTLAQTAHRVNLLDSVFEQIGRNQ